MINWKTLQFESKFENGNFCSFGVTEAIIPALVAAGLSSSVAGVVATGLVGAATGAGVGGLTSAFTGGNIGQGILHGGEFGAVTGGIGGGVSAAGGLSGIGDGLGSLFGDATLGSDIGSGLSSFGSGISDGVSDLGHSISSGLGFGGSSDIGSGLGSDFGSGLSGDAYAPATAASSAPGSIGAGFTPNAASGGSLGGGTTGGFFQDPSLSEAGNSAGGFFSPGAQPLDNAAASGGVGGTGNALGSDITSFANAPSIDNSALSQPIGSSLASPSTAQTAFDNAGSQTMGSRGMDLSSIFSGGGNAASAGKSSPINGALRATLSSLFNQNPYSGSPQIANTLNNSAQQYNPYVQGGGQAESQLSNLYGLNGQAAATGAQQDWQNTPGYQFQLAQGTGALQNSAAAAGGLLNGNTGQALQQYGQGLANTTYQQYVNNLQGQVGQGQSALGSQASLQGQAAQLQQQPKQYKASQFNQGLGGLLGSLFQ